MSKISSLINRGSDIETEEKPYVGQPSTSRIANVISKSRLTPTTTQKGELTLPPRTQKEEQPRGLFKVLDILQRSNFTVANAAKAAVEGEPIIASAARGLLGKDRNTFSDVLTSLGWKPLKGNLRERFAKGVVGFALDTVFDPLTYVGVGGITRVGQAAQKVSKLAPTVAKQAKLGQRALLQFMGKEVVRGEKVFEAGGKILNIVKNTKVGDKLGRTFIPNFRPASVNPYIWKEMTKLKTAAKNVESFKNSKAMDIAIKTNVLANKAIKEHGDEALVKTLTAIEKPSLIKNLPEDLQEIATLSRNYLDELKEIRQWAQKGVIDKDDFKYLPHLHKSDYMISLKNIFGKSSVYGTSSPSDKARKVFKFADDAGNVLGVGSAKDLGLIEKGKKIVDKKGNVYSKILPTIEEKMAAGYDLERGIANLLGVAGRRTSKLEKSKVFFDDVADLSVNKGGVDNFTKLKDAIGVKAPDLKGYKFHPELAREIDATYEKLINPETIANLLKIYDKIQNSWKGLATFVNPSFHSRNAASNVYQNLIGGVKNPVSYAKATILQSALKGDKASPAIIKLIDKTLGKKASKNIDDVLGKMKAKYLDDFEKQGLGRNTFFGADIEQSVKQRLKPTLFGSEKLGLFSKAGQKTGSAVETNARLTHFIDKIDKGFNPESAAESVRKFLFDYEELTDVERNIFKRVVPFYTWTRKNLPLQAESLINNPRHALGIAKGKEAIEDAVDVQGIDKKLLPEWLKNAAPVILGSNDKGILKVAKLEGYLPAAELNRLSPKEMSQQLLAQTSPLIKTIPELIANINLFYDRKIQEIPGERKDLLRLKVNPYLDHVLRQIRPLNELDKLIGKPFDKVKPTSKIVNLLFGGKIYHIDKRKQTAINRYLLRKKKSTIKSKIKYRLRLGDFKEAERLRRMLSGLNE